MIAEKMTGDKSRDYMNARRVSKEYEAITRGLDRSFLSLPPCGSIDEIKQVWFFISHTYSSASNFKIHPSLDIVNEPVRPLLFTISSHSLYQGKVFL